MGQRGEERVGVEWKRWGRHLGGGGVRRGCGRWGRGGAVRRAGVGNRQACGGAGGGANG